ncbi:MAG TPA: hypothetical protein VIO34_11165 [Candidatus Dormibacteraeota bacterium]|jgi:hypothetical protein
MKRLFVGLVMAATATIGFGSVAFAAGSGYNPPPQVTNVCDAGHGAFGAFSDPSLHFNTEGQPPYFGDNVLGSAPDGLTGLNNSSYSATCNL